MMRRLTYLCSAVLASIVASGTTLSAEGLDLGRVYPATLEYTDQLDGYEWSCEDKDVWRVTEFRFDLGEQYRIVIGSSQVVFGCHESNVLWAAVFPDTPGKLSTAPAGQSEHVTSVWLRFHPARVSELFPSHTISGQGDPAFLLQAKRLAAHKMRCCWQSGGRPAVPLKQSVTIDVETTEGTRRFYSIDTDARTVKYVDAFRTRTLPQPHVIDRPDALAAFDAVWNAFDREYAMFVIKPDVDWAALRTAYREQAATAKDDYQLGTVLAGMLAHLRDLHVYVKVGDEFVPGFSRERWLNGSRNAAFSLVGLVAETHHDLAWARSNDRIGYIKIDRLTDPLLPQTFDELLATMDNTRGLILDLRFNGGGSEPLGQQIAGRFLDRSRVYSLNQYRNGPKHSDLGPKHERSCGPSGPWHYTGPVIVLIGQRTMSSAESFALMLAQCPQVTTMGDHTAGSSGNPKQIQVAGGRIIVNLPRWLDMTPDGKPIDTVGIAPDIPIAAEPSDFTDTSDPVLTAALERLRKQPMESTAGVLVRRAGAVASSNVPAKPSHRKTEMPPEDRPHVAFVFPSDGATGIDPITEIRIRFDRPMSPMSATLGWNLVSSSGFRLRGQIQYSVKTNEFVIPVVLTPGQRHQVQLEAFFGSQSLPSSRFADRVAAEPYDWSFTTRDVEADTGGNAPQIVSIVPPPGSQTSVFTEIHVQFDRPMMPECYDVRDATAHKPGETGLSIPFPVRYEAETHSFIIPTLLPPGKVCRIELGGFRNAEGGRAETTQLEYQVGNSLLSRSVEDRIATAAHDPRLRQVVTTAREARLAITSLEESVQTILVASVQPAWSVSLECHEATFRFQGKRQFFADVSDVMNMPFLVGSDGRQCWNRCGDELVTCPFDEVDDKNVLFCDPFGTTRFDTADDAIRTLKLEYLGSGEFAGRECDHIRSWNGNMGGIKKMGVFWVSGLIDWLIDTKTHLPVVVEPGPTRYIYSYRRVGEMMPDEDFQPRQASPHGSLKKAERLGDGFDRRFLNARDGSDGRMSVRWGKTGSQGRSSSGLN